MSTQLPEHKMGSEAQSIGLTDPMYVSLLEFFKKVATNKDFLNNVSNHALIKNLKDFLCFVNSQACTEEILVKLFEHGKNNTIVEVSKFKKVTSILNDIYNIIKFRCSTRGKSTNSLDTSTVEAYRQSLKTLNESLNKKFKIVCFKNSETFFNTVKICDQEAKKLKEEQEQTQNSDQESRFTVNMPFPKVLEKLGLIFSKAERELSIDEMVIIVANLKCFHKSERAAILEDLKKGAQKSLMQRFFKQVAARMPMFKMEDLYHICEHFILKEEFPGEAIYLSDENLCDAIQKRMEALDLTKFVAQCNERNFPSLAMVSAKKETKISSENAIANLLDCFRKICTFLEFTTEMRLNNKGLFVGALFKASNDILMTIVNNQGLIGGKVTHSRVFITNVTRLVDALGILSHALEEDSKPEHYKNITDRILEFHVDFKISNKSFKIWYAFAEEYLTDQYLDDNDKALEKYLQKGMEEKQTVEESSFEKNVRMALVGYLNLQADKNSTRVFANKNRTVLVEQEALHEPWFYDFHVSFKPSTNQDPCEGYDFSIEVNGKTHYRININPKGEVEELFPNAKTVLKGAWIQKTTTYNLFDPKRQCIMQHIDIDPNFPYGKQAASDFIRKLIEDLRPKSVQTKSVGKLIKPVYKQRETETKDKKDHKELKAQEKVVQVVQTQVQALEPPQAPAQPVPTLQVEQQNLLKLALEQARLAEQLWQEEKARLEEQQRFAQALPLLQINTASSGSLSPRSMSDEDESFPNEQQQYQSFHQRMEDFRAHVLEENQSIRWFHARKESLRLEKDIEIQQRLKKLEDSVQQQQHQTFHQRMEGFRTHVVEENQLVRWFQKELRSRDIEIQQRQVPQTSLPKPKPLQHKLNPKAVVFGEKPVQRKLNPNAVAFGGTPDSGKDNQPFVKDIKTRLDAIEKFSARGLNPNAAIFAGRVELPEPQGIVSTTKDASKPKLRASAVSFVSACDTKDVKEKFEQKNSKEVSPSSDSSTSSRNVKSPFNLPTVDTSSPDSSPLSARTDSSSSSAGSGSSPFSVEIQCYKPRHPNPILKRPLRTLLDHAAIGKDPLEGGLGSSSNKPD